MNAPHSKPDLYAHSTPEPDNVPPEGDPVTPPPEKMPDVDPVPIEEPTPPQPPVKMY